uniref:Integral membrane bound transporter domain-containing protein n=1 Tax=Mucochytrium quahogii TaxID=96639 RepID=A0A7S2W3E5_9STRA|mmetsp:Transcript_17394/g.29721  ORF Transcript_17394/g.29721 Transcript_17394/m.29721 type:complete len:952 (+) Transcript_17394:488-3343(+)|eukprot:CAMPEP_0203753012 /NCGR_PEP_ID=MMETSP0098-20131031/6851_1 /ASSEMBLY_ACC=CAM_ASM_000208 /TAXON_ID=96639 /ORGANISM=" , Strain NY0313808BC1" /LENGTH=951 /DNA_ID=CAMNT_0050643435 /DNA_START=442 /DNA_END=3297 /DNA_ORIENTATION=-
MSNEQGADERDAKPSAVALYLSSRRKWELSIRMTVGLILPLALCFGGFYENSMRDMVPIFYVVWASSLPPYMSSVVFGMTLLVSGVLPALGVTTGVIAVAVHTQSVGWAYAVIIASMFILSPWMTGKTSTLTRVFLVVFVALETFVFILLYDVIFSGTLYGFPSGELKAEICGLAASEPPGALRDVAELICQKLVNFNNTELCIDWPTDAVAAIPKYAYLNDFFSSEKVCLVVTPDYDFITMTRNTLWICKIVWNGMGGSLSVASSLAEAVAVSLACYALALLLPPQRFIRTKVRSELLAMTKESATRIHDLMHDDPRKIDSYIKFNDTQRIESTIRNSTLTALEFHLEDPGPMVGYWPQFKKVAEALLDLRNSLYFAAVTRLSWKGTENKRTLELIQLLTESCADAISLQPTAGDCGKYTFLRMKTRIDSICSQLEEELPGLKHEEADEKYISADIETPWFNQTPWFLVAEKTISLSSSVSKMLELQSTPSIRGLLTTLGGLCLLAILPWLRLVMAYTAIPRVAKACCANNRNGIRAILKRRDVTYNVQFCIAIMSVLALPVFSKPVRNWLLTPVGAMPTGKFGMWAMIPIFNVLFPTVEGTMKRAHLRICGTLAGAFFGYCATLAFSHGSIAGGGSILGFTLFIATFTGVRTEETLDSSFNRSYGYMFQLTTWTSVIIAVDWAFSCSTVADVTSLCQFTPGEMTTLRVLGQSFGIVCALAMSHFVLPRYGGLTARELLSDALRLQKESSIVSVQRIRNESPETTERDSTGDKEEKDFDDRIETIVAEAKYIYSTTTVFDEVPFYRSDPDLPAIIHLVEELLLLWKIGRKYPMKTVSIALKDSILESGSKLIDTTIDCILLNSSIPVVGKKRKTCYCSFHCCGRSIETDYKHAVEKHMIAAQKFAAYLGKLDIESNAQKAYERMSNLYFTEEYSMALCGCEIEKTQEDTF